MPEAPLLVKSGTFLVDRRRALEKLMRFQLPDARLYVLALVRCAVAGEASKISFRAGPDRGIEVSFDGRPFSAAEFDQPYAPLFQEPTAANRRNRELATALLSLLRLGPALITIRSGEGDARVVARIESLESQTVQPADDGIPWTLLRASMGGALGSLWDGRIDVLVRERCLLCPIPIEVQGDPILATDRVERPSEMVDFRDGGLRGWIGIPRRLNEPSEIAACRCGVLVETIHEKLPLAQVRCALNDDDFAVNASQTGLISDERLKRALAAATAGIPELIRRAAAAQDGRMEFMGRYLDSPPLLRRWNELLEEAAGSQAPGLLGSIKRLAAALPVPDRLSDLADAFPADARRTLWLRQTATRKPGPGEPALPEETRRTLWQAPLFIGCDLKPLSPAELKAQLERIGHVPYSETPFADVTVGFRALWAYSPLELDHARRLLGGTLTDVTPLLEQARRGGLEAAGEVAPPAFEAVGFGFADIFVREPFDQGEVRGEVALAAVSSKAGARAYMFVGGILANSFDLGGDRAYLAVVSGSPDPARVQAAVEPAVLGLYRKAAQEYSPGSGADRDSALRRHLLGFLLWAKAVPGRLESENWIVSTPLFTQPSGVRSYADVLAELDGGQTLLFSAKDEPDLKSNQVFRDAAFTEDLLRALFPDYGLTGFPGRDDLVFLFRKPDREGRSATASGCLLQWKLENTVVGLSPGEGPEGRAVHARWGIARVFGPKELPAPLPDEAGAALLLAVLREHGALPDPELRRFVLEAARHFAAPWRGPAGSAQRRQLPPWHRRLLEILAALPFFRAPGRPGMSLERLGALLESGDYALYAMDGPEPASAAPGDPYAPGAAGSGAAPADLLVGEDDLALLKALWPNGGIRPAREGARPAHPPSASGAAGTRAAAPLAFDEPMLYEEALDEAGLRCLAGLPRNPMPGVAATVLQGGRSRHAIVGSLAAPLAGSLLVDASRYHGPLDSEGELHPDLEKALAAVYRRFLSSLLERWPSLDPATGRTDELSAYLLLLLIASPPQGPAGPEWEELRRRTRSLAMFRSAAGEPVSLDELERRACADGFLAHLPSRPTGLPDTAGFVVVLPYPQLVSKALGGVSLRKFAFLQPGRAKTPARPRPEGSPLESRLADLISDLRGSRGLDHSRCPAPETVRLVAGSDTDMLPRFSTGQWEISSAHPLVALVMRSGLASELQAEYLASLAFTEANRRLNNVTDAEDIAFQEALANRLIQDL